MTLADELWRSMTVANVTMAASLGQPMRLRHCRDCGYCLMGECQDGGDANGGNAVVCPRFKQAKEG